MAQTPTDFFFERNADRPDVNMGEVVETIVKLAAYDEADLLRMASSGELASLLPFHPERDEHRSPMARRWDETEEIPPRPLTEEEYNEYLHGR